MSLNSINTNNNASIALQSLNATSSALQATEKKISTGYRVADATDDGAAYAVAQQVRSDVGALTTANQQLGSAKGLVSTTISSLNDVSNKLGEVRQTLLDLSSTTSDATTRNTNIGKYKSQIAEIKSDLQKSNYVGKTLVGDIAGSKGTYGSVGVAEDEFGSNFNVAATSGTALFNALSTLSASLTNAAGALAAISTGGVFTAKATGVTTALATYGAASNHLDAQQTFNNNNKIDALNTGLGALVDADLTKESAKLQALQVRQQLATQSLSIANQAPQSLLSLFK